METSTLSSLSVLNDAQREFVTCPRKDIRLLAPAGSGKTHSLLWRCKWLADHEDTPQRFLLLSFTKVAAVELESKLMEDDAFESVRHLIEIRTLNAWGAGKIRKSVFKNGELLKKSKSKDYFVQKTMRPVWTKYPHILPLFDNYFEARRNAKNLLAVINAMKSLAFRHDKDEEYVHEHVEWLCEIGLTEYLDETLELLSRMGVISESWSYDEFIERFWDFYCEFVAHMALTNTYVYEDQKYYAWLECEKELSNDQFTTGLARKHHIMVDEFQDINVLDLELLKVMAKQNKTSITIVGDDDQAIYEWRGASPSFIIEPDAHLDGDYVENTFTFDVNYRSPPNIVTAANRLITQNYKRVEKNPVSSLKDNADIVKMEMDDYEESAEYVVDLISTLQEDPEINQVAVISRLQGQLLPLQVALAGKGISYALDMDLQLYRSDTFQTLIRLLDIKQDAIDGEVSREDVLHLMDFVHKRVVKKDEVSSFKKHLREARPKTPDEYIRSIRTYTGPLKGKNRDRDQSFKFAAALSSFFDAERVYDLFEVLDHNFKGFEIDFEKSEDDVFFKDPPFYYLAEYSKKYSDDFHGFQRDLSQTVEDATFSPDEVDASMLKRPVHLMTAFRTKGKQFDAVILLGVNDKIWPKATKTAYHMEQERRIFYVALTRARKKTIFHH